MCKGWKKRRHITNIPTGHRDPEYRSWDLQPMVPLQDPTSEQDIRIIPINGTRKKTFFYARTEKKHELWENYTWLGWIRPKAEKKKLWVLVQFPHSTTPLTRTPKAKGAPGLESRTRPRLVYCATRRQGATLSKGRARVRARCWCPVKMSCTDFRNISCMSGEEGPPKIP